MDKPKTGVKQSRDIKLNLRQAGDGDSDKFEFSWSSEYPVDMYWFEEILSHEEKAINFERLAGMNLLWNHERNVVLGKIERVWVEDKKAYCEARWSKKASIQEYRQDVADGIITNASFLYSVEEYEEIKSPDPNGEGKYCFLGTKWTPYEISLVSVPADPTVGIGRSASEFSIKGEGQAGKKGMDKVVLDIETQEEKVLRLKEIQTMGDRLRMPELSAALLAVDAPLEVARETFQKALQTGQSPVAKPIDTTLGLSNSEQKSYSLLRAIRALAYPHEDNNYEKAGFERECSNEIAKRLGRSSNGFFMPVRDLKVNRAQAANVRTLTAGTNSAGGFSIETELMEQDFIELLRNQAMVTQMGARILSGLVGRVDIPSQESAATAYWVGEEADITESQGTLGLTSLRMKTLGVLSRYTRELVMQSSIDVEQWVRQDQALVTALEIDRVAIHGTGSNNQPRGILNTSGIGSIALGTNGGQPTWASIVNLVRELRRDNADIGAMQWLTNPEVEAKLMTTPKQSSGVEGNFILADPGTAGMVLRGYRLNATNQVRSDLTKGTGTGLSALLIGVWNQLIIGEWGVLEVLVNPYSDSVYPSGAVQVRTLQSVDMVVRHPECFAAITDMITT